MTTLGKSKRLSRQSATLIATTMVLGVTFGAGNVYAKSCVTVDESRDNLSPEDRRGATLLFEEALRDSHREIGAEGDCDDPFTLYHIRLGTSLTIVARNKTAERKERVSSESDLPNIYSQMVRSMDQGISNTAEGTAVTRTNVTYAQSGSPHRIAADGFFYMRLGIAGTHVEDNRFGPTVGFGGRWALDHVALDASFLNFNLYRDANESSGGALNWMRFGCYYYLNAQGNHSPYFGGALGITSQWLDRRGGGDSWRGWGLTGDLTAGLEFLRASSVRLFTEANLSFPAYRLSAANSGASASGSSHTYAPQATLSLGIGFGRAR